MIANNSIMQIVIVSKHEDTQEIKEFVEILTHPPLYCNEEEIKDLASEKRKFKLCFESTLSLSLMLKTCSC